MHCYLQFNEIHLFSTPFFGITDKPLNFYEFTDLKGPCSKASWVLTHFIFPFFHHWTKQWVCTDCSILPSFMFNVCK